MDELNQSRLQSLQQFENALALLRGTTRAVVDRAQIASDKQRAIVEAICLAYFPGQALQAGSILEEENT